jgi:hypothetical protein
MDSKFLKPQTNLVIEYNNLKKQDEELKKEAIDLNDREVKRKEKYLLYVDKRNALDDLIFETKNSTDIQKKEFKMRRDLLEDEYQKLYEEQLKINKELEDLNKRSDELTKKSTL